MPEELKQRSEVARLRAQISAEYQAAQRVTADTNVLARLKADIKTARSVPS